MSQKEKLIEIKDLQISFGHGRKKFVAVDHVNFDIYKALRYNMLIVMLLPSIVMLLFYKYILKGKKKIPNFVWCFLLVLTILFGILRNIPYFYYLAPN